MKTVYVITGTTKGIGKALVKRILQDDDAIIVSLSRSDDGRADRYINFRCDLQHLDSDMLATIWKKVNAYRSGRVVLINNAGQLYPIDKLGNCDAGELAGNLYVNLTVPILLINSLIQQISGDRMIVNISSGAAHAPYSGWSAYCSGKAGLDMLTRCVAEENHPGVSVVSIAPGVVDTAMQDMVRSRSKEQFDSIDKFIALKENNQLSLPDDVADRIVNLIQGGNYNSGDILDLRNL